MSTAVHWDLSPSQLLHVLELVYGRGRRGRPDTAAISAAHGVSRRTVQRWLHGSATADISMPESRLEVVRAAARPRPATIADERAKAAYARRALAAIAVPRGRAVEPAWREQRWLDEHVLAVVELPALGLRRPTLVRATGQGLQRLHGRGDVVDHVITDNRFAAVVVKDELLRQVDQWRVQAPLGSIERGRTETWLVDAELPDLAQLARRLL